MKLLLTAVWAAALALSSAYLMAADGAVKSSAAKKMPPTGKALKTEWITSVKRESKSGKEPSKGLVENQVAEGVKAAAKKGPSKRKDTTIPSGQGGDPGQDRQRRK